MALAAGSRLGAYEILAPLGAGGMGEVYRARDTKLGREVALKTLPASFTHDSERIARFKREAQVLATLNHPNIAGIYGIDEALSGEPTPATIQFLTLELVDGETLASRLERGPLALDDAVSVARQIGEALQAAHEKGIVHRDLKPANIALTHEGHVKVLDFGLAKALEQVAPSASGGADSFMQSPTITTPAMTQAGMILGTAAYMAPEQAKGRGADKRSDVWGFGCVFYEMLTARRAFEGEDVSDTLAAVLRGEPDWSALPLQLPHTIAVVLRRCLERDRRRRLADISTVLFLLDQPDAIAQPAREASAPAPASRRWTLAAAAFVLVVLAGSLGALAGWRLRPALPAPVVGRFLLTLAEDDIFTNTGSQLVAVAPDGTSFVYVANRRLFLRTTSDLEARPIPGTDLNARSPVFSPTGESIAFASVTDRTVKRVPLTGGAAVTLSPPLDAAPLGLSWAGNFIYYGDASTQRGISRVPATGGKSEQVVSIDQNQFAHGPHMLPDGEHVLFTLLNFAAPKPESAATGPSWIQPFSGNNPDRWDQADIVVQSIATGERRTVIHGGSEARYVPTGHIVYAVSGVLFAISFDAKRLQTSGVATPVIEGVRRTDQGTSGTAHFDFSNNGVLVYVPGPKSLTAARRSLGLLDRKGNVELLKLPPGPYFEPRLSPDGARVAFVAEDDRETNVWVYDLDGKSSMRRLTQLAGRNRHPVWSPDSQHIAFQSDREGDLAVFRQRADGTGVRERLTKPAQGTAHVPESWSPDGSTLLVGVANGNEFWSEALSVENRSLTAIPGLRSIRRINATFSPDGKWLAYSTMTGPQNDQRSVFVRPFPPTSTVYQVTTSGHHPFWSRDGRELFFVPTGFQLAVMSITTRPSFSFSEPTVLSRGTQRTLLEGGPQNPRQTDATLDGRVMAVFTVGGDTPGGQQIHIVLNWFQELTTRLPKETR